MQHHETLPLVALKSGKGAWLFDQDGNRYLDAISSWWTNIFGHANPFISKALKDQLDTLEHAMLAGCTHEPVVELSERLSVLTGNTLGHCFYGSDGASAVEIALKMSFHYWKNSGHPEKQEFICLKNSYHGETIGALSVTDVTLFRDSYAPLIRNSNIVESPDSRHAKDGQTATDVANAAADKLEALLQEKSAKIAAIIVEPLIQCAAGFVMYDPLYLKRVRELCDRYKIHFIADEIAVGFGRTGTFFACEQAGIWPDMLCLSKAITGGFLPLSLVMTTDDVFNAFYDMDITRGFLHSHSYTGNPLACRAALATLDLFKNHNVIARNQTVSRQLSEALKPLEIHPRNKHFRNKGMIWAFDVDLETEKQATFPRRFFEKALQHELLMRPIGNTVYLMPPYILNGEEIGLLAHKTISVFEEMMKS
ncbi:adenosylmethionine--8-amino-7-oxononanoate transaminase [Oxalobacter formigenes]|nr:adenosylmethionine--8-amino-7-oxononanoate transaminase [Oxalobacter formigenes]ARQ45240.1 Adenosylmethionine-8-amino-7-oxononanoate aminotransferase [Oxalobacter formigenes]MCZ4062436.1 adenosylmethionine--8-amino-7-oxononanoate transaminase [Oxalobacter formigenes]WAW02543.1 adenosylmethionine--8-amino-7-oxononanoate transaminase [Oxalobacter formigenes]WAW04728.1 adenosylmethionine--8-amino-7-oxononanoate transaminase [Oxalobacter formigenes]WAW06934.1 adenosylmethionine--8-amino-7-oxono